MESEVAVIAEVVVVGNSYGGTNSANSIDKPWQTNESIQRIEIA